MNNIQQGIREFHEKAGQLINTKPSEVDSKTAILRVRLLLEEVLEFAEASGVEILTQDGECLDVTAIEDDELTFSHVGKANLVDIADALGDINYVSYGAAICYGIDMEPVEEEIHKNNMLKFENCTKDENGKIIKNKNHKKVNLKPILDSQSSVNCV